MKSAVDALKRASQYVLSDHAKERIRQRIGLTSAESAVAWVKSEISNADKTKTDGNKTHYITDSFEIICDGVKVVTVKPTDISNEYLTKIGDVVENEVDKLLTKYRRELRKADIAVAETQLNFLRARNPKVKQSISEKMTEAIDYKAAIEDEIKAIEYAGKRYGVEV